MKPIVNVIELKDSFVSYRKEFPEVQCHKNPIVFLHGTNSSGNSSFAEIKTAFSRDRAVIIPDYAGCGNSELPPETVTIEHLAEQVAAVIAESSHTPVDLVGVSLGAVVAAVVAANYPNLINKLILTAPWATNRDPRHQLIFKTWLHLERNDKASAMAFGLSHALSAEFLSSLGQETLQRICAQPAEKGIEERIALGLTLDIKNDLTQIGQETLVIGLNRDTLIPPYLVREVDKNIKNSTYREINSGHAVHLEKPTEWVNLIKDFIN
ncbi:alpha/beta fold hydrolase [Xenorhabdus sp. IM139775]|uniref:alpha/beta fold hydrolase n=1 Tax=Xenorhabdus sp. IM139775 TaxID=3025876 RepID=UPI002359E42E|nr:alpha/beta hydrolase [Xenorhabdus sp. IM139775]MDC9592648.1 alpha/beta hydrolase [Xenorhabdus sp. IM139775]